jgi:hypothetical protein
MPDKARPAAGDLQSTACVTCNPQNQGLFTFKPERETPPLPSHGSPLTHKVHGPFALRHTKTPAHSHRKARSPLTAN